MLGAVAGIHPDDGAGRVVSSGFDRGAGSVLTVGSDSVLQIQDHQIGRLRLGESRGVIAWAEHQHRPCQQPTHDASSGWHWIEGPGLCRHDLAMLVAASVFDDRDALARAGGGQSLVPDDALAVQGVAVADRPRETHLAEARSATIVPCVRCPTDSPTTAGIVSGLSTNRSPNSRCALDATSRCSVWAFIVIVVSRRLSASLIVRSGACRYVTVVSSSSNHKPCWATAARDLGRSVSMTSPSLSGITVQAQARTRSGFSMSLTRSARKREPCSPSISRWSKDRPRVPTSRSLIFFPTAHGCLRTAPSTRIADSPGGRIGVPVSTPNTPTLVIENVPPVICAGVARPSRATEIVVSSASASSRKSSCSASLTFGTSSPRGVAAAIPRFM